jgi:hypothetical protein
VHNVRVRPLITIWIGALALATGIGALWVPFDQAMEYRRDYAEAMSADFDGRGSFAATGLADQTLTAYVSFPMDQSVCDSFLDSFMFTNEFRDQLSEIKSVGFTSIACKESKRKLDNVSLIALLRSRQLTQDAPSGD